MTVHAVGSVSRRHLDMLVWTLGLCVALESAGRPDDSQQLMAAVLRLYGVALRLDLAGGPACQEDTLCLRQLAYEVRECVAVFPPLTGDVEAWWPGEAAKLVAYTHRHWPYPRGEAR